MCDGRGMIVVVVIVCVVLVVVRVVSVVMSVMFVVVRVVEHGREADDGEVHLGRRACVGRAKTNGPPN